MSAHAQSVEAVRRYYDALGDQEWTRLTNHGRVSLEVHRCFLRRFIRPGMRVLEVGAGSGRFTLELAAIGARIVVTDLSEVQLALNDEHLRGTVQNASWSAASCLTSATPRGTRAASSTRSSPFGGPLSYAFERTDEAMRGLLRILRPEGVVVASLMSMTATCSKVAERRPS